MLADRTANVVLLTTDANLSAFQQLWFLEHGILERDDFGPESVFTPIAVNIKSPRFELLILPQRFQITFAATQFSGGQEVVNRVIGRYADSAGTTAFLAVGFNFEFDFEAGGVRQFSRRFCLREDNPLANEFQEDDSRFGLLLTKQMFDARLSIRISPKDRAPGAPEALDCRLNYHHAIQGGAEDLRGFLPRWSDALRYSRDLLARLDQLSRHEYA